MYSTIGSHYVLVWCSLKVLTPSKIIKETEIEGCGSLKGKWWKQINCVDICKKSKQAFPHMNFNCDSLSIVEILQVFLIASNMYTVLPSLN